MNYEILPVNLDKAELIISLISSKKSSASFKSAQTLLQELEDQFYAREKEIRAFQQVSPVILDTYQKKMFALEQLSHRIKAELHQHELALEHLRHRRGSLTQTLDDHEAELANTRAYAEQRRNKKSKREKQYHQLYHVPLVATQYEKKYVRARDKNSAAEEQVSQVRSKVDACQQELTSITKSLIELQTDRDQLTSQLQDIEAQLKTDQTLVSQVQQGKKFLAATFIPRLKQAHHVTQAMTPHTVEHFKAALSAYKEAESQWIQLQVWKAEFQCSSCDGVHMGWPKPDKVRTNAILCEPCYQNRHTSMVFEKKMSSLLSLTGSSSQSIVESSSPKMLKNMMNKFKRSSSSLLSK